ncbi:MAG: SpoIIE family protein phosphatase [Phycisphaerales bacterium]|nr:SpoIIE family protein phosphatase [Phycisphaerales bacterium]
MSRISLRYGAEADWQERLRFTVELMRETSRQHDPSEVVAGYAERLRSLTNFEAFVALSRRGLERPRVRVTRSTEWAEQPDPWSEREKLPLIEGGVLSELVYSNEARIIDHLEIPESDPAYPHVGRFRSAIVVPIFDNGEALNVNLVLSSHSAAFDPEFFPELVWTTNLFGRGTKMLVLQKELREAYERIDEEMQIVGRLQRSLLPSAMPQIASLDLAAHYEPSTRAGGDYYDVFDFGQGRWGILLADVCGHGPPAAVLMAITHSLAHMFCKQHVASIVRGDGAGPCPAAALEFLNEHLEARYTRLNGSFVTAFFAVFDEHTRTLTFASAGHNPPRVKRCSDGSTFVLDGRLGGKMCEAGNESALRGLPLGIEPHVTYESFSTRLAVGDQIVFYTDGITEARNPAGELFGTARLDQAIEDCRIDAEGLIGAILESVERFSNGRTQDDDRTILVAKVR